MKKLPIFQDLEQQTKFDQDGYLKFELFDKDEILALKKLSEHYFPIHTQGLLLSSAIQDVKKRYKISEEILKITAPKILKFFKNYKLIGGAFLIKGTESYTEVPLHQDWTIVDESIYYATIIWIPLVTTDGNNGALEVIKGSHNWNYSLRAPTLPFYYAGFEDKLKENLEVIDTKPGEMIIFNRSLIHYSKPNLSNQTRPAISLGLITKKAPLQFYYWDKDTPESIEVFEQDDDFFLNFEDFYNDIFLRPKIGNSLGFRPYKLPEINEKIVDQYLAKLSPKTKSNFLTSLFKKVTPNHS